MTSFVHPKLKVKWTTFNNIKSDSSAASYSFSKARRFSADSSFITK